MIEIQPLPCERCAHAAVCKLKPELADALDRLFVPTVDEALQIRVVAGASCGHFLEAAPAPVADPHANIPRIIPEASTDNLTSTVEVALGPTGLPTLADEPGRDADGAPEPDPAPASPGRATRPLEAAKVACDPGCGGLFVKGVGIAAHQRHCSDYQQYRATHLRVVEPLPGALAPAAMTDALAARTADDTKHHQRARAAADATWRARHPEAHS